MFRPRTIRATFLINAALLACAGPAVAALRLPVSCSPSFPAFCRPLGSVHPASTLVADGAGGTYLVWMDGELHLRLLRLRSDLTVASGWRADGLALAPELRGSHHIHPALAADGEGGVYVAWIEQDEALDLSLRVLRLRGDGRLEAGWPSGGVRLVGPSSYVWYPSVALIPGSGVAVAWTDLAQGMAAVRVLALDGSGRLASRWPSDGLVLGLGNGPLSDAIELAVDDRGGIYATWTQIARSESDLMVAYASEFGVRSGPWTVASEAVPMNATLLDSHPELVVDGREATVLWNDATRGDRVLALELTDVLAQRLSPDGRTHWDSAIGNGHIVAAGPGYQHQPHMIADGAGGAWFCWNQMGPGAPDGGHLTHLGADGRPAAGWSASGIAMGSEVSGLQSDLDGGALVTFFDGHTSMLQRLPRGWSPGATPPAFVSLGTEVRSNLRISPDGLGGAFLAWEDRTSAELAVRIDHIDAQTLAQPGTAQPTPVPQPPPVLAFAAYPIFPNPAQLGCNIHFDLPERMAVDVEVFDVMGRRVARPAQAKMMDPGPQSISWALEDRAGRRVSSGLYLVRIKAGTNRAVLRLAVTR